MAGRIDVENLRVTRGEFTLEVDSLHVREREIFAILGTTGSGKTVLMESIAGAFPINEGSIKLDDKDIEALPIQQRHLGILYQDYALFPHLTVWDNIAYGLKHQRPRPDNIDEQVGNMLHMFEIEHLAGRYPGVISGGESQRVALARALVMHPEILILDEPFSALDPTTKRQMYKLLRNVHESFSCTIVFVTHDMDEAIKIADNILLMKDGEIVQSGSPEEILRHPANDFVKEFIGKKRLSKVQDMATVEEVMVNHPRTVHPTRGLAQSMTMMEKNKVDSLLVVDNQDKLLGNITIYDVVKAFDDESLKVQDIMKPFEHSVTPDTLLPKAIQLMDELKAPYLPVVNDTGHLVGLLTRGSIVGYVSSEVEVML